MEWLKEQGFSVVENHPVSSSTVAEEVAWFESHIKENAIPSDGLVLTYDDIAYGQRVLVQLLNFQETRSHLNGQMRPERLSYRR